MKTIQVRQRSVGYHLPIRVNGVRVQTVSYKDRDVPIFDTDPTRCGGTYCKHVGFHSWFNHSMDSLYGELPPGTTKEPF